jgi:hypothetical protein
MGRGPFATRRAGIRSVHQPSHHHLWTENKHRTARTVPLEAPEWALPVGTHMECGAPIRHVHRVVWLGAAVYTRTRYAYVCGATVAIICHHLGPKTRRGAGCHGGWGRTRVSVRGCGITLSRLLLVWRRAAARGLWREAHLPARGASSTPSTPP